MKYLENMLFRRPRILNALHRLHLARPVSQTIEIELQAIERYAHEAQLALEIGSYQGVSATRIAAAMASQGILYCVDPWPSSNGRVNPCYSIFDRHLRRRGLFNKIRVIQQFSGEVSDLIPDEIDFAFVDGDHSWAGIERDWFLVRKKLRLGGIACLHDSLVPFEEPWRKHDSAQFYQKVICADDSFTTVDRVYSLVVLRKTDATFPPR